MRFLSPNRNTCYEESVAITPEQQCIWPEIMCQFEKLCQRHNHLITSRERLHLLAEPRERTEKYEATCECPPRKLRKTSIVRLEKPVHKRTEQLSYPPLRQLLTLKTKSSYSTFSDQRKQCVNRMMRKSLMSLYSRLSNAQPPPKPIKKKSWGREEWRKYMPRIKRLAIPKPTWPKKKPKKPKGKKRPYIHKKPSTRYMKLARPKKIFGDGHLRDEWQLTPEIRDFVPSPRLIKLSKPRIVEQFDPNELFKVSKYALGYVATPRIKLLAKPPPFAAKPIERTDVFKVSRNALRAKLTDRLKKLSDPKDFEDMHYRENAFSVKPSALKGKATPRIIELAKHKVY